MELIPLSADPKKLKRIITRYDRTWPMYLVNDNVSLEYWEQAMELRSDYQFVAFEDGKSIATVNSIPQVWDGKIENLPLGWDDALKKGVNLAKSGEKPNTLCALAVTISKKVRGGGRSLILLNTLKTFAKSKGFEYFIVGVRPVLKHQYPLLSLEQYMEWKNEKGEIFDPWVRTHIRANSKIVSIAKNSMTVESTVENWKKWTGLDFQHSGEYVIPRGLNTLKINLKKDTGLYTEDNIWMFEKLK